MKHHDGLAPPRRLVGMPLGEDVPDGAGARVDPLADAAAATPVDSPFVAAAPDVPAAAGRPELRFLTRKGFRVVTAAGHEEGLRRARELRPEAIALDMMMPGVDGWGSWPAQGRP